MKNNNQSSTPNVDALIDFIKKLTPEQADKLVYNLPLLRGMIFGGENA